MTPAEFKAFVEGRGCRLKIRCGADNGRCGKIHAAFDDKLVAFNPAHNHEVVIFETDPERLRRRLRPQIAEALRRPWYGGKPAAELVLRPRRHRLRRDREELRAEEWLDYRESEDGDEIDDRGKPGE